MDGVVIVECGVALASQVPVCEEVPLQVAVDFGESHVEAEAQCLFIGPCPLRLVGSSCCSRVRLFAQAPIVADASDDPGDPIALCNLGIEVLSAPVLSELLDDLVARFVVLSSAELKYVA